ncbi:MAG: PIG-L family deacetylase [Dehalococcoidia bacterium]|jgi:LmbE family N-acetylglucosaminyl deacetylase|nr:MAG: PIG-L family deacetylase [Dehalococcoidia bacterium]
MTVQADILVVCPHPDDAEVGIAGTVANWTRQGKTVVYAICTSGEKGTSDRSLKPEKLARIREREQMAAARVLGVKKVVFLRYPDQSLEDTLEFRKEIVRLIRRFRPEIVATGSPYRRYLWHRDHRITGQVVLDAVYPYARDHLAYPDLLAEGLEPHKVKEVWLWAGDETNHHTDITDTFDIKIAALRCHQSQNLTKAEAWLRDWAVAEAEGTGFKLAEGFYRAEAKP